MLDHYSCGSSRPPKCGVRQKHHYLPKFYLKKWAIADGTLCEFSRPYWEVTPQRKHPSATGFEYDLYAVDQLPLDSRNVLESDFMKNVDQRAANVLKLLLVDQKLTFSLHEKVAWSHFILSLIQRAPERIGWLCEHFDRMRRDELAQVHNFHSSMEADADRAAFENVLKSIQPAAKSVVKALLIQAMNSLPDTIAHITNMRWRIVLVDNGPYRLLTSDQPVVMSDGLQYTNSYILFPISPAHVFMATNSPEIEFEIDRMIRSGRFVSNLNHHICMQAEKYVYDLNDMQLRFVENRLGKSKKRGTRANQGSFPL